ncbi:MAG: ABC transporter permease [Dehalococcoidia bacterium]|nr:ABC transporter permease [Dehalococcoidia bacterium]
MAESAARTTLPRGEYVYKGPSRLKRFVRTMRANPLGAFGLLLIAVLVLVGLFAPVLRHHEINQFAGIPGRGPTTQFWFGTDKFGQDIYSRVVSGARISLQVGFLAVALGTAMGMLIGAWAGYKGGWVDVVSQRIIDTMIAFPQILFLLVIVRVLGPSMRNVIIAIAVLIVPSVARIVRSAALVERNNLYIEAARSIGSTDGRILLRHIIPNILPVGVVVATTLLGSAILAEASLSFLGLGIPPPNPSWGNDINVARTTFPINLWAALFPGLAISLTVLGFNLLGDAARDIFDPRLRGR